ncbi:MAG: PstS family phosphate ABC transporter substrate-binding protein [Tepidiformaceae bacterium]
MRARWIWWPAALLAAALLTLAGACGGDDDDDATAVATPVVTSVLDYGKLSGSVRIDGSSTVFPISEAVAEEFSKVAKNVRANVAFSGTGGGFEKFCRGEIEVSNASRPIKEKEEKTDLCAKAGITDIVELQVAIDALTVVVSPQNTWAKCMTPKELNLLYRDGGAKKWNDIRPEWPADSIKYYYPGADSGTFDYFKEAIITAVDKDSKHRSDGTSSEDDNVLVQGVEGDKNSVGYFGFAYFEEAGKKLKAVEVDSGGGCVAPSFDNALTGKYKPLSRPLFIYTRESFLKEKPQVLGFIKFYVDNMGELAKDVGYISLPDALTRAQKDKVAPFLPK